MRDGLHRLAVALHLLPLGLGFQRDIGRDDRLRLLLRDRCLYLRLGSSTGETGRGIPGVFHLFQPFQVRQPIGFRPKIVPYFGNIVLCFLSSRTWFSQTVKYKSDRKMNLRKSAY